MNFDVGYFGTDNPATAVAERMPFVVQTDGKNNFVNIGIVSGAARHARRGHHRRQRLFGGTMNGAAPGAKIVSSRACLFVAGCTAHALIEGMIYVAKQATSTSSTCRSAACRRSTTATTPAACSTTA